MRVLDPPTFLRFLQLLFLVLVGLSGVGFNPTPPYGLGMARLATCRKCGSSFPSGERGPLSVVCGLCRTPSTRKCLDCDAQVSPPRKRCEPCVAERERARLKRREEDRRRARQASSPPKAPPKPRDYSAEHRRRAELAGRPYMTLEERRAQRPKPSIVDLELEANQRTTALILRVVGRPWLLGRTRAEKERIRRKLDPEFALQRRLHRQATKSRRGDSIANNLRMALKRNGTTTAAAFGYTIPDLRAHLERQFLPGMTWDRFCAGEIEIDHILPLRMFDLTCPRDIAAAWALSNLRPLWATDNRNKSGKRTLLM